MPLFVFDLNETLLDLKGLDPAFEAVFGDARKRTEWFGQVVVSTLTLGATGRYRPFNEVGSSALRKLGERHGIAIGAEETARVTEALRRLPPHPEVTDALAELRWEGHHLAVLTNSPTTVMEAQLANAGLDAFFTDRISVEEAGALKPAPLVYRNAAERLGVAPEEMVMVRRARLGSCRCRGCGLPLRLHCPARPGPRGFGACPRYPGPGPPEPYWPHGCPGPPGVAAPYHAASGCAPG
ncbi:haloacid dehalogenase type II [Thiohalorhabdus methylotrophus]|uniref:(S)-2-haloacid dehalogenase n=1 Tax=Thiohalorhabdus methylotrophus TaxID=3242694 RepID=A0ABV4TWR8_9GAMM